MNTPQVPPPVSTGWADFGKKGSTNTEVKTQDMFDFGSFQQPQSQPSNNSQNGNTNWFDAGSGFGYEARGPTSQEANFSTSVRVE